MQKELLDNVDRIIETRDTAGARELQKLLSEKVILSPLEKTPRFIAGVDAAFSGDKIISAACLYEYPSLELVEERHKIGALKFPYIPGLLSFREGPAMLDVINSLKQKPDLLIFDGQGIAHPRRLGIASFVGVILDMPAIGSAKTRLTGKYEEPGTKKGEWSYLEDKGGVIGAVVRTQDNRKPLFVSPGHRIDLLGSIEIVLGCVTKYRLAEPVRRADMLSKKMKP